MAAAGLATSGGYALQASDRSQFVALIAPSLNMVPALLVVVGGTVAIIGIRPQAAMSSWLFVVVGFVVGLLGETLDLPQWLRNVSPFEHVAAMPGASFDLSNTVTLLVGALCLAVVGSVAFDRRDVR